MGRWIEREDGSEGGNSVIHLCEGYALSLVFGGKYNIVDSESHCRITAMYWII